jgi:OmcA/MtrC family decaheme c-type cytochrome
LSFQLFDSTGAPVTDLKTNTLTPWAGTFLVAGPSSNPQRVYGSATGGLSMKATMTFDATTNTYTYSPATPWPANALLPINSVGLTPQPNPQGSYTVWFYWARTTNGIRDAVDAQAVVTLGANQTAQGRQVVTQAGCASCHGQAADGFPRLAEHGDQRKNAETCNMCHSQYAQDNGVGSTGAACTTSAQCGGNAAGWEACAAGVCTVTVDPTPGIYIDFQQLVHDIHFARLRGGYVERNNLGNPPAGIPAGTLNYLGFSNSLSNFQQVLSPVDVRSCTNCHADSKADCSTNACAYGQSCDSSTNTCTNVAWMSPTARACITCHDSADDIAHAALNTYTPSAPGSQPIESCNVCHATGAQFAVGTVHNITSLYSVHLAYPREPQ